MSFTHLHLHTEYSLLDGANRIRELPAYVKSLGMDSCAITDHGVLFGSLDFYTAMRKAGVKPILGCEVYVAPRSHREKECRIDRDPYHLILLAENMTGWKNLMWLDSEAFIHGFYYRPRIDFEMLKERHDGLIALSACLGGEIPQLLLSGQKEEAEARALAYAELFGPDHYYLELQSNGIEEQQLVNAGLIEIARRHNIPLVATNDCHYMRREDAFAHDVLLCMQMNKTISQPDRMRMDTDEFYVKSPEEMAAAFAHVPEAIENTQKIAARCNVELDLHAAFSLPDYKTPSGQSAGAYLTEIAERGLADRFEEITSGIDPAAYRERLAMELDIIIRMGFDNYYLIVWDFIRYAREQGIFVGPGRGSGAGSLVAYALRITNIDPLKYQLLFERFLNPERVSMPDFDIDFCIERRGEVIEYVTEKYGEDCVAQVITFGTLAPKAVIRDVGKALESPRPTYERLAKLIPNLPSMTFDKAFEKSAELKQFYEEDAEARKIVDLARQFEGMPRHSSTHAAGVVITGRPVSELAPLAKNDDVVVVQYSKNAIESVGLMKFDFLGLRTLTVLREAADSVLKNHGRSIDFDRITFDDPEIYRMIAEGKTSSIFQLESSGMTAFMKELKPESFEDIIAGISLYRPGPMDQIPRFVEGRHYPDRVRYDHPILEPILNVTYGCLVYQEQVMQICRDVAGMSLGQSDNVRRAISKKNDAVFKKLEQPFIFGGDLDGSTIDGAVKRGVPEPVARKLFADINVFAGYAFNKSHAAAYAYVAYCTAWMKYYYPAEFMAAMLNSFSGDLAKVGKYIRFSREMGIPVLPPHVNESEPKFSTDGKSIRFGLSAIKNIGELAVQEIVAEREESGPFQSFGDFVRRVTKRGGLKSVTECLIKSSAFDDFGIERSRLLAVCDSFSTQVARANKAAAENQVSFFDLGGVEEIDIEPHYPSLEELASDVLLDQEKEMLGVYVSGHPLDRYEEAMTALKLPDSSLLLANESIDADEENGQEQPDVVENQPVTFAGIVSECREMMTKANEKMARLTLEDRNGAFEVVFFARTYAKYRELCDTGEVLLIGGKVSLRDGTPQVKVSNASQLKESTRSWPREFDSIRRQIKQFAETQAREKRSFAPAAPAPPPPEEMIAPEPVESALLGEGVAIRWTHDTDEASTAPLMAMLDYFRGPLPVYLYLVKEKRIRVLRPPAFGLDNEPAVLAAFAEKYGAENVGLL